MTNKMEHRIWVVILFWSFVAALLAVVLSLGASVLLLNEVTGQGSAGYLSWGIIALSVLLSALAGSKSVVRERRLAVSLGVAAVFYLYTVVVKLLFFPGAFQNVWVNLAFSLAGGLIAFAFSVGHKRKKNLRKIKRR